MFATGLFAVVAHGAAFTSFVVFGDSLSDNGNAYIGTGCALPVPPLYTVPRRNLPTGRDTLPAGTAGGVWHEVLAGSLSEPVATPFLAGGTNYAVGGLKFCLAIPSSRAWHNRCSSIWRPMADLADPNALYMFWGGANDLYGAVETPGETAAQVAATESAAIASLANDITVLSAAGAKNFLAAAAAAGGKCHQARDRRVD